MDAFCKYGKKSSIAARRRKRGPLSAVPGGGGVAVRKKTGPERVLRGRFKEKVFPHAGEARDRDIQEQRLLGAAFSVRNAPWLLDFFLDDEGRSSLMRLACFVMTVGVLGMWLWGNARSESYVSLGYAEAGLLCAVCAGKAAQGYFEYGGSHV